MSQQINLFNPVFLAQKKYFSAAAMAQALGLLLGGLVIIDVFAARQTASLQRALDETLRGAAQRRAQLIDLGRQFSDQGTSKKLQDEIARTEEQLRKRSDLLNDLKTSVGGNAGGFSTYLSALARQNTQGVWLTGLEISGASNDLVIKGKALNANLVPAYVRALSHEPIFSGRSLSALQVTAKEQGPQAAPGGAPAVREPARYLEFTLNIPLGDSAGRAAAPERKSS